MPRPLAGARGPLALLALACFGLGLLSGWILRAPAPEPPGYLERLTADLGLSPAQVTAIDALQAEFDRELDELLAEHRLAMQAEVAARLDATEQAVLAVLDADQRRLYEELVAAEGR